jgi:hypothetical protein
MSGPIKKFRPIITAAFITLLTASAAQAVAPEYKACHGFNRTACKYWRDRSCNDNAKPAACDHYEARKQKAKDLLDWCEERYRDDAAAYRWCANGSPDS